MPILIDGNNLLHTLPPDDRSRSAVRRAVLDRVRRESQRVTVVFDGPPPEGAPSREALGAVTIVYAGSRPADDVIIAAIPADRSSREWTVVTDDHGLRRRARERGAEVRSTNQWRAARPKTLRREIPEERLSADDVDEWRRAFERPTRDDAPRRVPPKRRRRR